MPGFTRTVLALPFAVGSAVLLVIGSAVPASSAASGRAPTIGYHVLIGNRYSQKCLEILGYSRDNFAPAGQWTCHGGNNQLWNYSTSTGLIQNVHSGKCLEVLGYDRADGARVGQYDCYGGSNQVWIMNWTNGLIGNTFSGKCLEILGYSRDDFAPAGQWTCHGGANQQWSWPG
ncbi:RICIN domain-containing protein [Actinomadura scrupuli]|uniref:RICIN domain-containing protein n=1 Tax=Actinomadura scrupuli TaxID=559629 RepID=UPI003D96BA88